MRGTMWIRARDRYRSSVEGRTRRAATLSRYSVIHTATVGGVPAARAVPASRLASRARTLATTSRRVRAETWRRSRRPPSLRPMET
jgi:hypothetical protein